MGGDNALAFELQVRPLDCDNADLQVGGQLTDRGEEFAGFPVADCDAPIQRFVRRSRNSTRSVSIFESSILRTSGIWRFGWYSIVRPFSGVLASPST